jgi:hypothetical protein
VAFARPAYALAVQAVNQALHGGGGTPPARPALPNMNNMSDAEFQTFTREEFGFDSLK